MKRTILGLAALGLSLTACSATSTPAAVPANGLPSSPAPVASAPASSAPAKPSAPAANPATGVGLTDSGCTMLSLRTKGDTGTARFTCDSDRSGFLATVTALAGADTVATYIGGADGDVKQGDAFSVTLITADNPPKVAGITYDLSVLAY